MAVENLFPNYRGCNGIDSNRRHAEATEAVQAAWGRTVTANERNEREADARRNAIKKRDEVAPRGCVFAKSCNLPDGVINHNNPSGFVPVEKLAEYGLWAVLGTGAAITAQGTPLQLVAGSANGSAIAQRLGGSLSLGLLTGTSVVAAGFVTGMVGMLIPNTRISPDSAFYTNDQYATLETGRSRVRFNVKTLPDGSVDVYGFYTGGKPEWENVPVIRGEKVGEKYVADIGNGIGLTWTPTESGDGVLGIPALEGAPQLPSAWVYPPTARSDSVLANPAHPPEFQDAIIWFPDSGIEPLYIVLSTQLQKNKQRGKEYEDESFEEYSKTRPEAAREITIKADNGVKTRVDMIGRDADGEISCVECKSSDTAPLTKNQKSAFSEIEKTGGTVVGKGKPGFPGGTRIPPTRIDIIRPDPTL
ncbi:S-type pyocin domain-containing protein [Pseudomonas monsensis]|uniref:S-type pyocin domain-containing protein n=1 Tax=Pseudomonas monsensis TaxID=2745509 RepID=A0ABT3YX70_9PSED|nr:MULTISPECIES: S-type pyocin domain-containing protein [Pseudomonas]MCY0110106.1 S-type pyocin domain-containing protein [Pseudomonas monsensis]